MVGPKYFETMRGYKPRNLYNELKEYLRVFTTGYDLARKEPQILRDLGLDPKKNTIRIIVRRLRMDRVPIAAGSTGFWLLPSCPSEIDIKEYKKFLGILKNRGIKIFEVHTAAEESYIRIVGTQSEMKGVMRSGSRISERG